MNLTDTELAMHLCSLEESLLDPTVRRDSARVAALLTENFQEFGASGRVWSRNQILDLLATEEYRPPSMEDFDCRQIAKGVALVTYRTVRPSPAPGERAATLRTSLWTEQSGVWRMRFHQGTPAA